MPSVSAAGPASVDRILAEIAELPGCTVRSPLGAPPPGLVLPADLVAFYERCGGLSLFDGSDYWLRIRAPSDVVPVNRLLLDQWPVGDRSDDWYAVADTGDGDVVSVDLSLERLGRCYDSSAWTHGVAGSCPVVATSLTDLLARAVAGRGEHWWWLRPGFRSLGDAYDEQV